MLSSMEAQTGTGNRGPAGAVCRPAATVNCRPGGRGSAIRIAMARSKLRRTCWSSVPARESGTARHRGRPRPDCGGRGAARSTCCRCRARLDAEALGAPVLPARVERVEQGDVLRVGRLPAAMTAPALLVVVGEVRAAPRRVGMPNLDGGADDRRSAAAAHDAEDQPERNARLPGGAARSSSGSNLHAACGRRLERRDSARSEPVGEVGPVDGVGSDAGSPAQGRKCRRRRPGAGRSGKPEHGSSPIGGCGADGRAPERPAARHGKRTAKS